MEIKKHILIVEDVPFIYHEVSSVLENAGFTVDKFTPSVEDAVKRIQNKRPDLVLLDIELKGDLNGIFLGEKLRNDYDIPYIYVTDHDDNYTFIKSAQNHPEAFLSKRTMQLQKEDIVLKTKPNFDEKHLIHQIILSLQRNEQKNKSNVKEGLIAFVDLPKNISDYGSNEVSQRTIGYKDIEMITSKIITINSTNISKEREDLLKKEGRNIAKLITTNKEPYYYRGNLSKIIEQLPYNFVRINSSEIINLTVSTFDGRINGRRLKISANIYTISETYKDEVEKRIAHFYR